MENCCRKPPEASVAVVQVNFPQVARASQPWQRPLLPPPEATFPVLKGVMGFSEPLLPKHQTPTSVSLCSPLLCLSPDLSGSSWPLL